MNITPTKEQEDIIYAVAKGLTVKVAALAGTGKTSTLMMIAEAYPNLKGLYLAFNKSLQLDAQAKFPDWIDCRTVHGLAYQVVGKEFKHKLMHKITPYEFIMELGIEDITSSFKVEDEYIIFTASQILAWTHDIIRNFMFSGRETIELKNVEWFTRLALPKHNPFLDKEDSFYDDNTTAIDELYNTLNESLFKYARDLWEKQSDINNHDIPCEHDTYLKIYQLSKPLIEDYDYIMLDESQDANPCMIDILSIQKCQVIYVGDEYQQMYSFRGTINAMKNIEAETYCLTQSFRFGNAIAKEANEILKSLRSPHLLKGLPSIKSFVVENIKPPYTFIARNNLRLFEECLSKIEDGYRCCFVGNLQGMIRLIRSAYSLWCKKKEWVNDKRVSCFEDWYELSDYVREHDDQELSICVSFIMKYQESTLSKLREIQAEAKYKEDEADIILTTAHKAKGREWDNVILANDFSFKTDDDKNIYYVALTRAKLTLQHKSPKLTK